MITRPRASSPCSSNRCVIAVFIRPSPITPMRFSVGFFMTPPTVMPAAGGRHAKSAKSISKSATIGRPRLPSIAGGRTKGGWGATGAWSEPLDKINFAGKIQTPRDLLDRKSFIEQQWLRLIESRAAQKLVRALVLGGLEQRPQTGVADMSDTGQFRRPPAHPGGRVEQHLVQHSGNRFGDVVRRVAANGVANVDEGRDPIFGAEYVPEGQVLVDQETAGLRRARKITPVGVRIRGGLRRGSGRGSGTHRIGRSRPKGVTNLMLRVTRKKFAWIGVRCGTAR